MTSCGHHVVSNHQSFDCLLNSLCTPTSQKHQSPHYDNNGPNGHLFYVGGDLMMRKGMLPIIMLLNGDFGLRCSRGKPQFPQLFCPCMVQLLARIISLRQDRGPNPGRSHGGTDTLPLPSQLALCEGNSPVTYEFPAQKASNAEKAFIWWCHHANSDHNSKACPPIRCHFFFRMAAGILIYLTALSGLNSIDSSKITENSYWSTMLITNKVLS